MFEGSLLFPSPVVVSCASPVALISVSDLQFTFFALSSAMPTTLQVIWACGMPYQSLHLLALSLSFSISLPNKVFCTMQMFIKYLFVWWMFACAFCCPFQAYRGSAWFSHGCSLRTFNRYPQATGNTESWNL